MPTVQTHPLSEATHPASAVHSKGATTEWVSKPKPLDGESAAEQVDTMFVQLPGFDEVVQVDVASFLKNEGVQVVPSMMGFVFCKDQPLSTLVGTQPANILGDRFSHPPDHRNTIPADSAEAFFEGSDVRKNPRTLLRKVKQANSDKPSEPASDHGQQPVVSPELPPPNPALKGVRHGADGRFISLGAPRPKKERVHMQQGEYGRNSYVALDPVLARLARGNKRAKARAEAAAEAAALAAEKEAAALAKMDPEARAAAEEEARVRQERREAKLKERAEKERLRRIRMKQAQQRAQQRAVQNREASRDERRQLTADHMAILQQSQDLKTVERLLQQQDALSAAHSDRNLLYQHQMQLEKLKHHLRLQEIEMQQLHAQHTAQRPASASAALTQHLLAREQQQRRQEAAAQERQRHAAAAAAAAQRRQQEQAAAAAAQRRQAQAGLVAQIRQYQEAQARRHEDPQRAALIAQAQALLGSPGGGADHELRRIVERLSGAPEQPHGHAADFMPGHPSSRGGADMGSSLNRYW
ncbi:unnamed protein product [Pedinophyceae sp. YPF-701]|nr:unnamed protein product [Pedinophyceae sp. YPF-701]